MPESTSNYETVLVRAPQKPKGSELTVTSQSFADGGTIGPDFVYTGCGGKNRSPQLGWEGAPAETRSFAITCFDPDAPTGAGYWHWLVCDIPASVNRIEAGAGTGKSPAGGRSGYMDYGISSYGGPCPPAGDGAHRYIFTVYALDVPRLEHVTDGTTGGTFVFQMRGHVLASGSIMGRFGH